MSFPHTVKAPQPFLLIPLLLSNLLGPPAAAQPQPGGLQLLIVEGDGAINNVKQRVNRETIVQVEDENHKPIAGAAVIFFLPNQGPGGTFPNGSTTLTTTTNSEGQAVARGIRYNQQSGPMQLRVTASFAGQTATVIINQTNVIGAGGGGGSSSSAGMSAGTKWLIIAAIAGGAAAAGIIAGTHGGGSSSTSTTTTVTVTPGTPTVGGPQ